MFKKIDRLFWMRDQAERNQNWIAAYCLENDDESKSVWPEPKFQYLWYDYTWWEDFSFGGRNWRG